MNDESLPVQGTDSTTVSTRRHGYWARLRRWAEKGVEAVGSERFNSGAIVLLERSASNILLVAVAIGIPLSAALIVVASVAIPAGAYIPVDAFARFIIPSAAAMLTVDFGLKAARMISSHSTEEFRRAVLSGIAAVSLFSAEGLREGFLHERQGRAERAAYNAPFDHANQVRNATFDAAKLLQFADSEEVALAPESRAALRRSILDAAFASPAVRQTETPPPDSLVVIQWVAPFVLSVAALLLLLRTGPGRTRAGVTDRRRDGDIGAT